MEAVSSQCQGLYQSHRVAPLDVIADALLVASYIRVLSCTADFPAFLKAAEKPLSAALANVTDSASPSVSAYSPLFPLFAPTLHLLQTLCCIKHSIALPLHSRSSS